MTTIQSKGTFGLSIEGYPKRLLVRGTFGLLIEGHPKRLCGAIFFCCYLFIYKIWVQIVHYKTQIKIVKKSTENIEKKKKNKLEHMIEQLTTYLSRQIIVTSDGL